MTSFVELKRVSPESAYIRRYASNAEIKKQGESFIKRYEAGFVKSRTGEILCPCSNLAYKVRKCSVQVFLFEISSVDSFSSDTKIGAALPESGAPEDCSNGCMPESDRAGLEPVDSIRSY